MRAKVVAGETLATTAARLSAAVNADSTLPVTAVAAADTPGLINLTCRWAGATGNALDVRLNYASEDILPTGLRASITAMSGGAADPDMDQVIAALGDTWWKALVTPWVQKTEREQLEEWLDAPPEPMARHADGEVRIAMFDPCAWRKRHAADETDGAKLERGFELFQARQRQFAAVLEAHGVPVQFVHCAETADPRVELSA